MQPKRLDALGEERLARHQHLEAVMVRRAMQSRHHDAAVQPQMAHGEIEHRRRPEADAGDINAGGGEAIDQRRLKAGRTYPAVIAHRRTRPAAAGQHGAEGVRIRLLQGLADNAAARVVFSEERRVEEDPGQSALPLPTPR